MKNQFNSKSSDKDVEKSLAAVASPALFLSSVSTGICLFLVALDVIAGVYPGILGYGVETWSAVFHSLALLSLFGGAVYLGLLIDFKLVKNFGSNFSEKFIALVSGRFAFSRLQIITMSFIGAIFIGGFLFSFFTSYRGANAVSDLGQKDDTEISKRKKELIKLRTNSVSFKDEEARLEEDRNEAKLIWAEDKEKAENSVYARKLQQEPNSTWAAKEQAKLLAASEAKYKKALEVAEKRFEDAVTVKRGAVETAASTLQEDIQKTEASIDSRLDAVKSITRYLGVWPLILGLFLVFIQSCFYVSGEINKCETGSNGANRNSRNSGGNSRKGYETEDISARNSNFERFGAGKY